MLIELQSIGSKEQRTRDGPPMQYSTITSSMPTGMAHQICLKAFLVHMSSPHFWLASCDGSLHTIAVLFLPFGTFMSSKYLFSGAKRDAVCKIEGEK